jgi:hypothetical protein
MDFLLYAYLQSGQAGKARELIEEVKSMPKNFGRRLAGDAGAHKAIRNADVRHQVCKCHLLRCGTKTIVIGRHLFCRCGQILGLQLKPGARSIGHWTGQSLRIRRLRQQRTGQ